MLLPFEQVPALLAHLTGVVVGHETVRVLTETAGMALVEVETAEREALADQLPPALTGPDVQQISVDGAMVPLVGGQWAEAKTMVVGEVELVGGAPHAQRLSYFSRVGPADEFVPALHPELHRRGTERAGVVCAVSDGADWIQRVADAYRPDAVRILDFAHAAEHTAAAGRLVFGLGTAQLSEWLAVQLHTLRHGDPDQVLQALRELPVETASDPSAARAARAQELAYFAKRREQIQYAQFHAAGYPIGSGAVESANKLVVETRLKGAGMHWALANVNPLLALRAVYASGRWVERWPTIRRRLQQRDQERRHLRWATRRPRPDPPARPEPPQKSPTTAKPAPPTPTESTCFTQHGKPGPHHPWRASLTRRAAQKT